MTRPPPPLPADFTIDPARDVAEGRAPVVMRQQIQVLEAPEHVKRFAAENRPEEPPGSRLAREFNVACEELEASDPELYAELLPLIRVLGSVINRINRAVFT